MKYQLTDAALDDVREITRHIRTVQKSPQNAKLVVTRLKAAFGRLAATPTLGHVREELQDADARYLPRDGRAGDLRRDVETADGHPRGSRGA